MSRLLYIESSPRKGRSASIQVAGAFLDEYRKTNPGDAVNVRNVWETELPRFDGEVLNAKYAILHGQSHTEAQAAAWRPVEEIIADFKNADKFLISLPMWNFSIPYKLKHYIDILVQPGYTFSYSPQEGYQGLVAGKPLAMVCARGGAYGAGTGMGDFDLQTRYMKNILQFIGFTDIRVILVEPMLMVSHEEKARTIEAAKEKARTLARNF
jgi:FMN-dependent NADH-azoreductase